ncbi:MAG: hypothetical protein ACPG7F_00665 [Aggregatilineales bacterium]
MSDNDMRPETAALMEIDERFDELRKALAALGVKCSFKAIISLNDVAGSLRSTQR